MTTETMQRAQLESQVVQIKAHQGKALELLKAIYPVGSRIGFRIMYGQKSLSTGKVHHHCQRDGLPALRVWHEQAKSGSRLRYRDISFADVLCVMPSDN